MELFARYLRNISRAIALTRVSPATRLVTMMVLAGVSASVALACGSTLRASDSTPSPALNAANTSATAAFDALNNKLAAIREPTLAPGSDPNNIPTRPPTRPDSNAAPAEAATPAAPDCGATIAGWQEILDQYGHLYKATSCGPLETALGSQLIITTVGISGGPGAIATYLCTPSDASCLHGGPPDAAGAQWSVYPAPFPGGVAILSRGSTPDGLLLANGHYCFNLDTHVYNVGCY